MKEQFEQIMSRWEELSAAIAEPEVIADQERYQRVLKERSALSEQVEAWQAYQTLLRQTAEAEEMLRDPELADTAEDELRQLAEKQKELEQKLRLLLLPRDPDDDRSVVLEIRPSAGGDESALFAADLYRMYEHYAARKGFRFEPVSVTDTELGGLKAAVVTVSGTGAYAAFKYESGVHRVQRVPVTEASGRKQTSTCTVAVLPEAEEIDLTIDPRELRIDTYRASGHGGQYINRTDSAVRITHLPTGIVATCQDQKSQLKNREQAMKVLRSRLLEKTRSEADAAYASVRRLQVGTGDRSERIRTYNFHEGRVTDHRIGLTLYRIQDIMNGALEEIVDALRSAEQAELLRQSSF